jgi:hypothetical protein
MVGCRLAVAWHPAVPVLEKDGDATIPVRSGVFGDQPSRVTDQASAGAGRHNPGRSPGWPGRRGEQIAAAPTASPDHARRRPPRLGVDRPSNRACICLPPGMCNARLPGSPGAPQPGSIPGRTPPMLRAHCNVDTHLTSRPIAVLHFLPPWSKRISRLPMDAKPFLSWAFRNSGGEAESLEYSI